MRPDKHSSFICFVYSKARESETLDINNRRNLNEKYTFTNPQEKQEQIIIQKTPIKKEIEIPYVIKNNIPQSQESNNLNTLESAVIRHMDEEEEIRTLELEKERQKLAELEKEKQQLIYEEKERRRRKINKNKRRTKETNRGN